MERKSKRHKWNGKMVKYSRDGSVLSCVKCGCVKQYVGGFPTYFIHDHCYDKIAPPCDPSCPQEEPAERMYVTATVPAP